MLSGCIRRRVAYLLAADIVSGPLPSRLREVNQPVIITRNRFSRPRPCPLACICAHGAPPHHAPQPASCFRLSVATAAPGTGGLLSASTYGRSGQPPSPVYTAATPSLNHGHWWLRGPANPNQITTPVGHRFSSDQTITVLDPRHPLCGQTLPLVAITHHPRSRGEVEPHDFSSRGEAR